ncbi:hypothetical protein BGZ54_001866, partial [Gamsiella multidivaricata]
PHLLDSPDLRSPSQVTRSEYESLAQIFRHFSNAPPEVQAWKKPEQLLEGLFADTRVIDIAKEFARTGVLSVTE